MKQRSRNILLASTAIAIILSLGKSIAKPQAKVLPLPNYTFPEAIALEEWEFSFSQAVNDNLVKPPAYILGDFVAGKHYRYRQNDSYLQIEMRYLANTNGDLKGFITEETGDLSSVLKEDKTRGQYSLYTSGDKAYLSACINPYGKSTVTSDRFQRNSMIYDTRPTRIFAWLLGQKELRDRRCMWTHLSMPVDPHQNLKITHAKLETTWQDWYDWWQNNYPD